MKTKKHLLYLALALTTAFFWACNSTGSGEETSTETEEAAATETKYTLTPFSPSVEFPDAKIESMSYENGKFTFVIGGESYQLGVQTPDAPQKMCANSDKGQHIHLIVDNQPYAAKYTPEFEYDIPDGEHYLLAFLSRSYHESIKTPDAHVALKVKVKDKTIQAQEPITEPMLFYSRPKGTYVGKEQTDKVMLDFYLVNVELGDNYKVKVDINDEESFTIDQWQPYYIEGLPMGKNKIRLTLVDGSGNPVATPLNPVEREFELRADPLTEQ